MAVWNAAQARIREELGWLRTRPWLEDLGLRSLDRGLAWLEASSAAERSATQEHREAIEAALGGVLGRPVHLRISLRRGRRTRPARSAEAQAAEEPLGLEPERVNDRHQLSGFLAGPANELPLRFAQQAVERPGAWHPLVFYGVSGSGKTHLLQGIVNGYRRAYPGRRAVYTSSDRFSRQFVQAMRRRQTRSFRRLYREVGLLVIDDVQDLAGKAASELELVRTLDTLELGRSQAVLACSDSPKRIPGLEAGLAGRLLGGQVVELRGPDCETRHEIVRARCANGLRLPSEVVDLLVNGYDLDARELLSALTRLEAFQRHVGGAIDLAAAREILRDLLEGKRQPATIEALASYVAEALGVAVEQLCSRSRRAAVVRARQVSIGLTRDLTPLTLREVGTYFGGRSCASVHFAQERARELREQDPLVRELWERAGRTFERPATR